MKTLTCDLCDATAQGETFEDWMENLKPHWAEAHGDIMKEKMTLPEAEQKAQMMKWMEENKARFESAE